MKFKHIIFFSLLISVLLSCNSNPLDINTKDVNISLNFVNLDSIFVNFSENELKKEIKKSPILDDEILAYELGYCLEVGPLEDSGTVQRIKLFVQDPYISRVEQTIQKKFGNLSLVKKTIKEGMEHLNYHFPKGKFPQNIVFMNSRFNSSIFCTEREIGVSLERYLGAKEKVIEELPSQDFHQWIKDKMDARYLERDVLTGWISTHYVDIDNQNLAAAMISWGKIIYLTEAAFPKTDKSIIIRYTTDELKWAEDNEFAFWNYLVKEKLLFSNNEREYSNYLNFAPFTIGLPQKGPDRLGQYLGWKIIQSYMKAHPKTSLQELVKLNYNEIIQEYEIK